MIARFSGQLHRVITATTRPPRQGEQNGIDYHFLEPSVFANQIKADAFYEWAEVHGHTYGTLKASVDELLRSGTDIILNIDVQGAATFRKAAQNKDFPGRLISIFILPPNIEELRKRMCGRGLDAEAIIEQRLHNAKREIATAQEYDHRILSGSPDEDLDAASQIYTTEQGPVSH